MTVEQKKVSLTLETDWLTFEYVDRLSKTLETIHQSIGGINEQTAHRFEELREWSLVDPTEWLEDIEDELEGLRKKIKEQKSCTAEYYEQLKEDQTKLHAQMETFTEEHAVSNDEINQYLQQISQQQETLTAIEAQLEKGFDQVFSLVKSENMETLKAIENQQQRLEDRIKQMEKKQTELGAVFLNVESRLKDSLADATKEIVETLLKELRQEEQALTQHDMGGSDHGEK